MKIYKPWYRLTAAVFLMTIIFALLYPAQAQADTGPKPTLTIYVENFDSKEYYLDLLGNESSYQYFSAVDGNSKYNSMHDIPLYRYNESGWKAIHMRTWLLSGDIKGEYDAVKDKMVHRFSYVGVPKEFKIAVQKEDGSLQVSDVIQNGFFDTVVNYDMSKNKVTSVKGTLYSEDGAAKWFQFLIRCILTIIIELFIALLFKIRKWDVIIFVNIITQAALNILLPITFQWIPELFILIYLMLEVIIMVFEFIMYMIFIKEVGTHKLIFYTLAANVVTFVTGLAVFYKL